MMAQELDLSKVTSRANVLFLQEVY